MAAKTRSKCADVKTADVEEKLEDYMLQAESRDLDSLLRKPVAGMSWKTAAAGHIGALLEHSSFWRGLLELAPCGILPPAVTTAAICHCNHSSRTNFTKLADSIFADKISQTIRIAMGKFRDCADEKTLAIVRKKLTMAENRELDKLLALLRPDARSGQADQQRASGVDSRIELDEEGFPTFCFLSRNSSAQTVAYSDDTETKPEDSGDWLANLGILGEDQHVLADVMSATPVSPKSKRDSKASLQPKNKKKEKDPSNKGTLKPLYTQKGTPHKRPEARQKDSPCKTVDKKVKKDSKSTVDKEVKKSAGKGPPRSGPGPRAASAGLKMDKKNVHSRAYHAEYGKQLAALSAAN